MRFLTINSRDELKLTKDLVDEIPPYAILSHRWGDDEDEVSFNDLEKGLGKTKAGYAKLLFCGKQARKDNLKYFWVDTCCIDKANHAELSEAITSMFRWYRDADRCYVHLSDVSTGVKGGEQRIRTRNSTFPRTRLPRKRKAPTSDEDEEQPVQTWESAFRNSEWFTRGWTLQELLAPVVVEFFSREGILLGNKNTLERLIHEITQIPITALRNGLLSQFSDRERLQWAANRKTRKKEDKAYCLLGIFDIFMPLMYGEGDNAFHRLQEEIAKRLGKNNTIPPENTQINLAAFRSVTQPGSLDSSPSHQPIVHWTGRSPARLRQQNSSRGREPPASRAVSNRSHWSWWTGEERDLPPTGKSSSTNVSDFTLIVRYLYSTLYE